MPTAALPPCRHCRQRRANRCRGLCWTCYYTPAISARYPTRSKFHSGGNGHRQVGILGGNCHPPSPSEPTRTPPGTPARVLVMAERARRGEAIRHEKDWGGES